MPVKGRFAKLAKSALCASAYPLWSVSIDFTTAVKLGIHSGYLRGYTLETPDNFLRNSNKLHVAG
jgi:hypothetical protein